MEALEVAGVGLAGIVTLALFGFSVRSPWDHKRLWDKHRDMAIVRRKVRKRRIPILGSLGIIWAAGIALQLVGKLVG